MTARTRKIDSGQGFDFESFLHIGAVGIMLAVCVFFERVGEAAVAIGKKVISPNGLLTCAIVFMIAACLILGGGCKTAPKCSPCPPEKAYIFHPYYGPMVIPKGFFDDKEYWKTEEEFRELMEPESEKEDGRQKREDRRQKTDDGGQKESI